MMNGKMSLTVLIGMLSAVLFSSAVSAADAVTAEPVKTDASAVAVPQAGAPLTEADIETKLIRIRELCKGGSRVELIQEFKDEDIAAWPSAFKDKKVGDAKTVEALNLRGTGFCILKDYERAEKDFKLALELSPTNGYLWNSMGDVYRAMKDDQKALDAYMKAVEMDSAQRTAKNFGWMPLSATLNAAAILITQTKYAEALKVMERYDDSDIQKMAPAWGSKMLRTYGQIYAGMGNEEDAAAKFKAALELEKK
jgi:tetratricopeptide (TPR) repeat protein